MREKHHPFIHTEFDKKHKNEPIMATLVLNRMVSHQVRSQGMSMKVTNSGDSPAEGIYVYVDAYAIGQLMKGGHYTPVLNHIGGTTQGLVNAEFYFYKKKSRSNSYDATEYYDAISIQEVEGRSVIG